MWELSVPSIPAFKFGTIFDVFIVSLRIVLTHFLMIIIANILQISLSTVCLVSVPLVENVILTNNCRCFS